jgi:hypothetical protein
MARLTTKRRKSLSRTSYALKSAAKRGPRGGAPRGAYPIPDIAHARNALARVSAHGTPAQKRTVVNAVARKYPGLAKRSAFIERIRKRK